MECTDVDSGLDKFYEVIYGCLDASVPKHEVRDIVRSSRFPSWFSTDLVCKIKQKNKLHTLLKQNKNVQNCNQFAILRQNIKIQTKNEYEAYKRSLEQNLNEEPSRFWAFIRGKSDHSGIPEEMTFEGERCCDPESISNAFAQYFGSVYETYADTGYTIQSDNDLGVFNFSQVTEMEILNSIKKLKPKKSTGPDGIPPYIYKGCAELLVKPLLFILNEAIKQNKFPTTLKESVISPIHKNGNKGNITNYRPISLLNILAKIFESILYSKIVTLVHNKISDCQHGFVSDRSTVTNLSVFSGFAFEAIKNKNQLDVIYTDCAKAFDKVNHEILLTKLVHMGFSRNAFEFVKSYLYLRPQVVRVGRVQSDKFIATSGVPQGSNLGPLLFIIFINDLPNIVGGSDCLLYADDFKLFKSIADKKDCEQLQSDLDSVSAWFKASGMTLNIEKCAVVSFTRKVYYFTDDYYINDMKIERKNEIKDLGVNFQVNMKFTNHYNYIVNRAYKSLGFVIRNSKNFQIPTIIRLYTALVRPHLEYASTIWSPTAECNINLVEKVQKRFLRYLYVRKNNIYPFMISYRSMLETFKLKTLLVRREIQAVTFLFFILNNVKYKGGNLVKYIHINVPKIQLRILNYKMFCVNLKNMSPVDYMMSVCNELVAKLSDNNIDLDIFNTGIKDLKELLQQAF